MSLTMRLYLKEAGLEKKGFNPKEEWGGRAWNDLWFQCGQVVRKYGRLWVEVKELLDSIPDEIAGMIEEISVCEIIKSSPSRESGIYRFGQAKAEVQEDHKGIKTVLIRTKGEAGLKDVIDLLQRIKVGSIRPEESYDGPQGGLSRQELEAENAKLKAELEECDRDLQMLKKFRDEVTVFYNEFKAEFGMGRLLNTSRIKQLGQMVGKLWTPVGGIFCQNCGKDVLPTLPVKSGSVLMRTCSECGCVIGAPVGKCP